MPDGPLNPREFGYYLSIAQVGMEMVAPIGVGLALDYFLGWSPWGVVGGAVLGLVGGVAHLVVLMNQREQSNSDKQRRREVP
jgi:F0F1-type ATP synthase assembly protein I